ncbi:alpha/beta hydrolase [Kordiimonas aquimaris]|uniref:alpha/beta hydrolase n=1 Tax=Kordiimonas aquimaris TaxID=707591 RepID=UPI0021CEA92C|nr:alpha/beta hydrolase [Kordiimonas aquimaris]
MTKLASLMPPTLIPLSIACALTAQATAQETSMAHKGETAITFEARSGETVDAYEGSFTVPENRQADASRMLTLKYVRFPATGKAKGTPTIYLAGGPGGSGINAAKHQRFPLFMAMREFGDVIAFDQRGTGVSNDLPECRTSQTISTTTPISDEDYVTAHRAALQECLDFLKNEGIDPHGYTTNESVADLNDLRQHLSAEKINLWGISYGSHLSLAALKQIDDHLNRVVIMAIEGLDQTVKQPARADQYFDRLQAAINTVPEAKAKFPDVKALIKRVLDRLEAEPLMLSVPTRSGETVPYLLQKRTMQQFTSALVADPTRAAIILNVYAALDAGITEPLVGLMQRAVDPTDDAISFPVMHILMDVASGSSQQRRDMLATQAKTSLLGLQTNMSAILETVDPSLDLGETFRAPPVSDVPVLLLSGTLDGRTYPESAQEATVGLSNRETVMIKYGGHNSFMLTPKVTKTIQAFMRGQTVDGRTITVELPDFTSFPGR